MADKNYIDPVTGEPCTKAEYDTKCASAGIITTTPTPTGGVPPPVQTYETIEDWYAATGNKPAQTLEEWQALNPGGTKEDYFSYMGGQISSSGVFGRPAPAPTAPIDEDGNLCSQSGKPAVTPLAVTPAPAYEISPEQKAWEELYGGKLTDWVEAGGYGIPEETQKLMIQQQTDTLKAREQENLRVMKNNMERRGITNSGFVFAAGQTIHSNTTKALAGAIADIQIKSALMKMASFETAMGQAGQFLGYLSEQSQLKYVPEFATWQAEQMAKMAAWQETMDRQKMAINQCYQTQNIQLQAQLQSQLAGQQHGYNIELAQMELEANQKAAKAEGAGNILGTIIGGIFSWLTG